MSRTDSLRQQDVVNSKRRVVVVVAIKYYFKFRDILQRLAELRPIFWQAFQGSVAERQC